MLLPTNATAVAIIAGGRDFVLQEAHLEWLDSIHAELKLDCVVEGGATGVDQGAREWATERGIRVVTVAARWAEEGRSAGPKRNARMANMIANVQRPVCILFPGGYGTASMKCEAVRAGISVIQWKEG